MWPACHWWNCFQIHWKTACVRPSSYIFLCKDRCEILIELFCHILWHHYQFYPISLYLANLRLCLALIRAISVKWLCLFYILSSFALLTMIFTACVWARKPSRILNFPSWHKHFLEYFDPNLSWISHPIGPPSMLKITNYVVNLWKLNWLGLSLWAKINVAMSHVSPRRCCNMS